MFRYVIYTYRLHIHDMFDEMVVMASMGLVKVLFKYFLLHCHFPVILLL